MDVTFLEYHPFFPVSPLQGKSVSEEPNCVILLEFTSCNLVTLLDSDPYNTILPTTQVPWIIYYRRNLRKEVESPIAQLTLIKFQLIKKY